MNDDSADYTALRSDPTEDFAKIAKIKSEVDEYAKRKRRIVSQRSVRISVVSFVQYSTKSHGSEVLEK
jgi:hypothetical protein